MQHIQLPTVKVEKKDGQIMVTHLRTGMQIQVDPAKLERWAMAQLRGEFKTSKEENAI